MHAVHSLSCRTSCTKTNTVRKPYFWLCTKFFMYKQMGEFRITSCVHLHAANATSPPVGWQALPTNSHCLHVNVAISSYSSGWFWLYSIANVYSTCAVFGCSSCASAPDSVDIAFYRLLPSRPEILKLWLAKLKLD